MPSEFGERPRSLVWIALTMSPIDRGIERADQDLLRLGRAQVGHLLERRGRAVVIDAHRLDQPHIGPAGAHAAQLVGQQRHALLHPLFGFECDFFDAHGSCPLATGLGRSRLLTQVPMRLTRDGALDVSLFLEVEHQDRQVVFEAHADGRHVHDLEPFMHDLLVGE